MFGKKLLNKLKPYLINEKIHNYYLVRHAVLYFTVKNSLQ